MQEEINDKTISLSVKTGKMTGNVLKAALKELLSEMEKSKSKHEKETPQGEQSMKSLMAQGSQLTNIEVTDSNIKSFDRVARKYGIDYCLKKDKSTEPPRYMVFFKARDVDVMTAAFKEYTGVSMDKEKKPSVRKKLSNAIESVNKHRELEKEKNRDRGQVL